MITTFKQISPTLLNSILRDQCLTIAVLEMGWDILETPLGVICVRTRMKKAVERMNSDEREVFFKLNAGQLNRLIAHPPRPRAIKQQREKEAAARRALEVVGITDKDWAADTLEVDGANRLEWLLCGGLDFRATPFHLSISGRGDVGDDLGCGPAHFLTVEDVREVAAALLQISEGDLEARVDSGTVDRELVSPGDLPSALRAFATVRDYYVDAATRGNAMLLFESW